MLVVLQNPLNGEAAFMDVLLPKLYELILSVPVAVQHTLVDWFTHYPVRSLLFQQCQQFIILPAR